MGRRAWGVGTSYVEERGWAWRVGKSLGGAGMGVGTRRDEAGMVVGTGLYRGVSKKEFDAI
jgi:hypothetical protein